VLRISVPEVEEIQKQELRVAPDGTIGIPLLGTMQVAGMTENDLRAAISQRVAVFMKHPRVEFFVESYQARDVAVMGAVQKPGLYNLSKSDESIMDVIGLAGGMTSDAAQKVIFVPPRPIHESPETARASTPGSAGVETSFGTATEASTTSNVYQQNQFGNAQQNSPGTATEASTTSNVFQQNQFGSAQQNSPASYLVLPSRTHTPAEASLRGRAWIVLDLSKPGNQACLDFPTRPGDAVVIPIAGQVMVQGWVANAGSFKITPGMTLLGAVSAAGGATFSWTAALLRIDPDGRQTTTEYSLTQLQKGEERDVTVQSGDVVVVRKSVIGAVPYALYEIFQHFGTGMGIPLAF
jgi:protein involved in polysaccharide export with SLBB domain